MARSWIARGRDEGARRRRARLAVVAPAIGLIAIAIAMAELVAGALTKPLGRRPLFSSLAGWSTMVRLTDAELGRMPPQPPRFVLGNSFRVAVAYWFYGTGTDRVYTLDNDANVDYGLVELLDHHGMSTRHLKKEKGNNAIFAAEGYAKDAATAQKRRTKLSLFFERVEDIEPADYIVRGVTVKRFTLNRCFTLGNKQGTR
jgi:hypothetical protein